MQRTNQGIAKAACLMKRGVLHLRSHVRHAICGIWVWEHHPAVAYAMQLEQTTGVVLRITCSRGWREKAPSTWIEMSLIPYWTRSVLITPLGMGLKSLGADDEPVSWIISWELPSPRPGAGAMQVCCVCISTCGGDNSMTLKTLSRRWLRADEA